MPMVQVRPRSRRKVASTRDREVQGMLLATLGSDLVAYGESTAALKSEESPYSPTRKAKPKAEVQPLAYRKVLATWPDPWRERWGRLANDLEDQGNSWRDAESRAFVEVWSHFRTSADILGN